MSDIHTQWPGNAPAPEQRDAQADLLKSHVAIIKRLQNERRMASSKVADAYKAVKNDGFNVKALRFAVTRLEMDEELREELEHDIDVYLTKLGLR